MHDLSAGQPGLQHGAEDERERNARIQSRIPCGWPHHDRNEAPEKCIDATDNPITARKAFKPQYFALAIESHDFWARAPRLPRSIAIPNVGGVSISILSSNLGE